MLSLWQEQGITGWDREFARKMFSFDQSRDHVESVCVCGTLTIFPTINFQRFRKLSISILSCQMIFSRAVRIISLKDFLKPCWESTLAANEPKAATRFTSRDVIHKTVESLLKTKAYEGIFGDRPSPNQEWFLRAFPGSLVRDKLFPKDGGPLHLTHLDRRV